MPSVKRALLFTSSERYLVLLINLVTIAIVSRLMPPDEIGLAVIGTSLYVLAQSIREFGASAYIVQQTELSREAVRSMFTVNLILTLVIAGAMILLGNAVADFYRDGRLSEYLAITGAGLILGSGNAPLFALLQRDMAFGTVAGITIATAVLSAIVTAVLAWLGFGCLSFAWAQLLQSAFTAIIVITVRPDWWIFRLSFQEWRAVVSIGGYSSATFMVNRLNEMLPSLIVGRVLNTSSVGLLNRATMICDLPLKGVLQGIFPIALPALAIESREGRCLKAAYLRANAYISVIQWPGLVVLCLLAHPVVMLMLGNQWLESVPLVRIVSLATLFSFPAALTFPMLVVSGRVADALKAGLISFPLMAAILYPAALHSFTVAAFSMFITIPLQNLAGMLFVKRQFPFTWRELAHELRGSAIVTICSATGCFLVIAVCDTGLELSISSGILAAMMAAAGWIGGLVLTRHPLLNDVIGLWKALLGLARGGIIPAAAAQSPTKRLVLGRSRHGAP